MTPPGQADLPFPPIHLPRPPAAAIASLVCWLAVVSSVACAKPPDVTITGGGEVSVQNYSWTITNGENTPVVSVEFPHYGALLFFAPDGWGVDCTSLQSNTGKAAPGVCRASVDLPERGIGPGQSRAFRMQVNLGGVRRGSGNVLIRFADGTQIAVAKVELPQEEAMAEKYMPLFGLALMLLIVVIVQCKRATSKSPESQTTTG